MEIGVDRVREDLEAIDQTRTGAAEVLRAVDSEDSAGANGWQVVPARDVWKRRDVLHRALDVEAAAGHDDDLRLPGHDLVPREPTRRLALAAQSFDPARKTDQFRTPVSARKRRIEPLEQRYPWASRA